MPTASDTTSTHATIDDVIWTVADIASFYKRSDSWARRKTGDPSFPAPTNGDQYRWWADDVQTYARANARPTPEVEDLLRQSVRPTDRIRRRKDRS